MSYPEAELVGCSLLPGVGPCLAQSSMMKTRSSFTSVCHSLHMDHLLQHCRWACLEQQRCYCKWKEKVPQIFPRAARQGGSSGSPHPLLHTVHALSSSSPSSQPNQAGPTLYNALRLFQEADFWCTDWQTDFSAPYLLFSSAGSGRVQLYYPAGRPDWPPTSSNAPDGVHGRGWPLEWPARRDQKRETRMIFQKYQRMRMNYSGAMLGKMTRPDLGYSQKVPTMWM